MDRITPGGALRPDDETAQLGLRRLGRALEARTAEVTEAMRRGSRRSGSTLDRATEDSFERAAAASTIGVARWMAEGRAALARDVGEEWGTFAQFETKRLVTVSDVAKRCLRWRDSAAAVVRSSATELELDPGEQDRALEMLQRSLDATLVRICEAFEDESRRSHEALDHREKELIFLATHDALTGLANRTLVLDRTEQTLTRTRARHEPVAALFVDLDNFKAVNDSFGHREGDQLLCAVAARLNAATRETDTLGRLGGDEFVVVADGISLAAGPELIAERLLEAFEEPFVIGGGDDRRVFVRASIGIATDRRASAEELLRDADIAMYRAKSSGTSRYVVFEPDMQEEIQTRMEIEMDLQEALQNEEFFLVYQPTFDLGSMTPVAAEALIRWRRPGRGIALPEEFVPLLEENGSIVDVGAWVLEEACAQAARWGELGYGLGLAVNVSARQLESDDVLDHVDSALRLSGLDAELLTIEITETALMRDAEETVGRLAALKDRGVRIAVDDFGTGYSSLAHLQRFPVDTLKIDRSFITQLAEGGEAEAMLRTLIQLGKTLAIETTAEGVERQEDLTLIKAEECNIGQGFLFARPLNVQDADLFFRQWRRTPRFEGHQDASAGGRAGP